MISQARIPTAVFTALEQCEIDLTHFLILSACYHWANRAKGYRVESYRAERVCILFGLDATLANTKKYQRALRDLADRNIVRCDYHRGTERTYSVWIPDPERFERVGTAAENRRSLWEANVVTSVAANVVISDEATPINAEVSDDTQPDNVVASVVAKHVSTSTTYQKTIESPLNPPSGGLLPSLRSPLKGEDAAAGLKPAQENQNLGQSKSLTAQQCVLLNECALQYLAFADYLYDFVPDANHVASLLREFKPTEILTAQLLKFPSSGKISRLVMAHFFASGARPLIKGARLNGESTKEATALTRVFNSETYPDIQLKWDRVQAAYAKIFETVADDVFSFKHFGSSPAAKFSGSVQKRQRNDAPDKATDDELAKAAEVKQGQEWEKFFRVIWDDLSVDIDDWLESHKGNMGDAVNRIRDLTWQARERRIELKAQEKKS